MKTPRRFAGFTIIEVIVSTFLFTVGFLAIYLSLIHNTRVDAGNQEVANALSAITTQANTDATSPFASMAVGVTQIPISTLPGATLTRTVTLSGSIKTLHYSIVWTGRVQPVEGDYELIDQGVMND